MSTEIAIEDRFACSPKALYDLLSDNSFDDKLMDALKMGKKLIEEEKSDGVIKYIIRLTNSEEMPAIARKFTGDRLSYKETRIWTLNKTGNTWVIEPEVQGAKVEAKGVTEIVPDGDGCIRRTKGVVSVNLPLIGKKIESMVLDSIVDTFKKNAEFCRTYIKDNQIV